jgi:hypothetical protein
MEIKDLYVVLTSVSIISVAIGVLMYLMSRSRNDRYDLELKRMQLDAMRQSLEKKGYEANESLMADPERWKSVNHLLIEALRRQDNAGGAPSSTGALDTRFFESVGVNIRNIKVIKKRVFVLTPFHPKYEHTYKLIQSVCARLHLECVRGDEEFKPGAVLSHILELMAQASIIVVNIDGRNPNVYYELGIAHAIGKKTILLASDIDDVPFDLQSQRIVLYKTDEELERTLASFLARSLVDD